jgi:hypothetical protein
VLISDDNEFRRVAEIERAANGKPSYLDMDEAFGARMRMAIDAGLESAPVGVITSSNGALAVSLVAVRNGLLVATPFNVVGRV